MSRETTAEVPFLCLFVTQCNAAFDKLLFVLAELSVNSGFIAIISSPGPFLSCGHLV